MTAHGILLFCMYEKAVVDDEHIIGLELSSLMALTDTALTEAVHSYYDGFKISIVCSPDDYADVITSMCTKCKDSPQHLVPNKGDPIKVAIKEARNSYDKSKHKNEDVEGTLCIYIQCKLICDVVVWVLHVCSH